MSDSTTKPAHRRDPRHEVIEANLDLMLRWVRRGIRYARKTGRLQAESRDVLNGAIASFLEATDGTDYDPSQPVEEVWEELRSHLNRKIGTWRRRVGNRGEQAIRPSDVSDPEQSDAWLAMIEGPSASEEHARLWVNEILEMLARLEDPEVRVLAELRMQTYTYKEIAKQTGSSYARVQRGVQKLKRALNRLAAEEVAEWRAARKAEDEDAQKSDDP